ncbi:hypothetical protein DFAR_2210017 [Desulfarculales bacterium]
MGSRGVSPAGFYQQYGGEQAMIIQLKAHAEQNYLERLIK